MLEPMRIGLLLLLACTLASAQKLWFGLTAGVPLSNLVQGSPNQVASTQRYTVGPTVEVGLSSAIAFEVGFLYKRLEFGFAQQSARATVHRWELPLLLRYQFEGAPLRPFIHAGGALNQVFRIRG